MAPDLLGKFCWEIRQLTFRRHPDENPNEAQLNGYRVKSDCAVTGWQIAPWSWNCSRLVRCAWKSQPLQLPLVHQNRRNLERFTEL